MTVIACLPGKTAQVVEIDGSLESMQQFVGGYIEIVYPFSDPVAITCNEEGKLNGLPLNRALCIIHSTAQPDCTLALNMHTISIPPKEHAAFTEGKLVVVDLAPKI